MRFFRLAALVSLAALPASLGAQELSDPPGARADALRRGLPVATIRIQPGHPHPSHPHAADPAPQSDSLMRRPLAVRTGSPSLSRVNSSAMPRSLKVRL